VAARFILVVLAVAIFYLMLPLITILNRCDRFPGFVYQQARFSADYKTIEISVRPRKGANAICSRCQQPAPGYDQLAERRFEFIPFWGFLVFLLYSMRRVDCRRCGQRGTYLPSVRMRWRRFGAPCRKHSGLSRQMGLAERRQLLEGGRQPAEQSGAGKGYFGFPRYF